MQSFLLMAYFLCLVMVYIFVPTKIDEEKKLVKIMTYEHYFIIAKLQSHVETLNDSIISHLDELFYLLH